MRNMKTVNYDGIFTLSAPSPKWVWNAQGQLVEVPAGQPAYDHDPVTGEPLGQRIETEDATNHVTSSEDGGDWISNVSGGTTGTAVLTTGYAESPRGDITASRLEASLGDSNRCRALIPVDGISFDGPYVHSVFIKSNTGPDQDVYISGGGGQNTVVVTVTPEWRRFNATSEHAGTSLGNVRVGVGPGTDTECDILIWGSQFEEGGQPSSYIPTDGSAVTRAADVATIPDIDQADWYKDSDEGAFLIEVVGPQFDQSGQAYILSNGANRRWLYTSDGEFRVYDGDDTLQSGVNQENGVRFRAAITWNSTTKKVLATGGTVQSGPHNGNLSAGTALEIFAVRNVSSVLSHLSAARRMLSDSEMQDFVNGVSS